MKSLKWLGLFIAFSIGSSLVTSGLAWAVARQLNQNVFADLFTGEAGSGSNAFAITTNGARLKVGSGTNDYLSSDGTTVSVSSRFSAGAALASGQTAINVPTGTYVTLNAGEGAFIRAATNGTTATIGDLLAVTGNDITANTLRVPVVHGSATVAQALESGTGALTASALILTFTTAFGAAPTCVCSHIAATPLPCGPIAASSTTAVTFAVPAGAGSIYYICIGQR